MTLIRAACHPEYCPYRRKNHYKGCTHPHGLGKVFPHRSSTEAVPANCPLRREPVVIVPSVNEPGDKAMEAVTRLAQSIVATAEEWVSLARTVYGKRSA